MMYYWWGWGGGLFWMAFMMLAGVAVIALAAYGLWILIVGKRENR